MNETDRMSFVHKSNEIIGCIFQTEITPAYFVDKPMEPQPTTSIPEEPAPDIRKESSVQPLASSDVIEKFVPLIDENGLIIPAYIEEKPMESQQITPLTEEPVPVIRQESSVQPLASSPEIEKFVPIIDENGLTIPAFIVPLNHIASNNASQSGSTSKTAAPPPVVSSKAPITNAINTSTDVEILRDLEIVEVGSSLYIFDIATQQQRLLCNFIPRPERQIYTISRQKGEEVSIDINIITHSRNEIITVTSTQLDNTVSKIKKSIPTCYVNEDIPKAVNRIVNYIRKQLTYVSSAERYVDTGWQMIGGRHVYLHDGISSTYFGRDIIVNTGKTIERSNISLEQSRQAVFNVLSLSQNLSQILPLLLFAHTALLWNLFKDAGFPPLFVLFVNGPTGSFKTAVCLQLFTFFNCSRPEIPATFKDTQAALEIKMAQCSDSILLVDDFHPSTTSAESKQLESSLERMIRFFGDGIGKTRGTQTLDTLKELKPHGMCVITGEDTSGTNSSLLRCLMVEVTKGSFDSNVLTELQRNPLPWSTHLANFVEHIGMDYDGFVSYIKSEFPVLREQLTPLFKEKRSVQMACTLILTARIVLRYCFALDGNTEASMNSNWYYKIIDVVMQSEAAANELSPGELFLVALFAQLRSKKVVIAPDIKTYQTNQNAFIGYQSLDSSWLLEPNKVYQCVSEYWAKIKPIHFSQKALYKSLEALCVLCPQIEEVRSGSAYDGTRKYYLYRNTLEGRPRFLKLMHTQAEQIVEAINS